MASVVIVYEPLLACAMPPVKKLIPIGALE